MSNACNFIDVAEVTMVTLHQTLPLAAVLACVLVEKEVDSNMPKLANWISDQTKSPAIVTRDIQVSFVLKTKLNILKMCFIFSKTAFHEFHANL